jgi:FkbM family methyltransferase
MAWLPFLVPPDRIAIDVGAHAGAYTAELLRLSRQVIAVEPNPATARLLHKLFPDAAVVAAAASGTCGSATLTFPSGSPGLGGLRATSGPSREMVVVDTVMLDALVNGPVGFIKIDVEGHELEVLKGAGNILRESRPNLLIEAEERHRSDAISTLVDLLRPFGYSGFFLGRRGLLPISSLVAARDQRFGAVHAARPAADKPTADYVNNFIFVV